MHDSPFKMILIYLKLELVQDETGAEATESEIQNSSYEVMNYMIDKALQLFMFIFKLKLLHQFIISFKTMSLR